MGMWDTIRQQELNFQKGGVNPKFNLLDFGGVVLGVFFAIQSIKILKKSNKEDIAYIGLVLAGIMIYVHSLKFFEFDSTKNKEKHINELGKSI